MKIRINGKVYGLKYVESDEMGDSLMELVEEKGFRKGDIICDDGRIMIVKDHPNKLHCLVYPKHDSRVIFGCDSGLLYGFTFDYPGFRYVTEQEKNILFDLLKKEGKRWNAEKKCIEDIPQRKFKAGDRVRIKNGISSETHQYLGAHFHKQMDTYIGNILKVLKYDDNGFVYIEGSVFCFSEDWLELIDELKIGDWVIAWSNAGNEIISKLLKISNMEGCSHPYCVGAMWLKNAVKWDGTKEQLEKVREGK